MEYNFNFEQEENILIEKATKRKEEELLKKINAEKAYLLRKHIVANYFIRMSVINKIRFLRELFDNFNDIGNVLELANFISLGDVKPLVYLSVSPYTNFKRDKLIKDHNRCLNLKALEEAIESDMQWFKNLSPDQQVDIITSLLRNSGGNIRSKLYFPILRKCFHNKKFHTRKSYTSGNTYKQMEAPEMNKVKKFESQETIFSDHPVTIDVENQRRNWNQIISKYKEKVQGNKPSPFKGSTGKDLGKNEKKKEKKAKNNDGNGMESIDWIQLLPIWNVKKIFNYFDQKTLQKLKKVNSYWSYVVQDIVKERKMRTQLNKEIEKLKAEIGPVALETALEMENLKQVEEKPVDKEKKRRVVNYERGAILKKMVPKETKKMVQTSLLTETAKEVTEDVLTENVISFPREVAEGTTIYKYQPCLLKDVHVVLGVDEDINEVKSFLTYSLDTQSATLSLSVDRQTLEEW